MSYALSRRLFKAGLGAAVLAQGLSAIAPRTAQAQEQTLRFAYGIPTPSLITESLFHADKQGYVDREQLKLDIAWLNGDTLAIKAVIAGEYDAAWVGTSAAIQAVSKGAKLKVLYSPVPKSSNALVAQQEIKTLADLRGHSIAVSSIGAISYHIPRVMLKRAGVDLASVQFVALGGGTAARYQALIAKKVDGGLVDLLQLAEIPKSYPHLHTLAFVANAIPELHYTAVIASEQALAKKNEALIRLARADIAGVRYLHEHPKEAAEGSMARMRARNPQDVIASFELAAKIGIYGIDGGLDPDNLQKTVALMVELGEIEKPIPVESFVDRRVLDSALAKKN